MELFDPQLSIVYYRVTPNGQIHCDASDEGPINIGKVLKKNFVQFNENITHWYNLKIFTHYPDFNFKAYMDDLENYGKHSFFYTQTRTNIFHLHFLFQNEEDFLMFKMKHV